MMHSFKHKVLNLTLFLLAILVVSGCFCINAITELNYSLIEQRSLVLYDRSNNVLGYSLSSDTQSYRFYTKKEDVSPLYLQMLLASEDKRFNEHMGVDFLALMRSSITNLKNGSVTSGGSTIAMQVVKRLTKHKRTYLNKLKEVVQAIYLTQKIGREEVLNWYLTLAPYGSNIEGVKAASLRWFKHLPNKMTPSEAALLTALPRAPELIRPDKNPQRANFYKNDVLRLAYKNKVISYDVWQSAIKDELPNRLFPITKNAQTLADYLFNEASSKDLYSYIDPFIQEQLQRVAHSFRLTHNDGAILSIVVLDANKHEVVGVLGSSDSTKSQLCIPFYKRSPGSTLKPFAYAMAFDSGQLHPSTLLHDSSRLFGSWHPENFSRSFRGLVSARQALTTSLNLPALEVLALVGADNFINNINKSHKRLFTKNGIADYSVILGSGSINLLELTKLYAMLNEDGREFSYALLAKDPIEEKPGFLTKESARATFNILLATNRPPNGVGLSQVSYKTGTSSHFTDALAIGSLANYTVGVSIVFPDNRTSSYSYTGFVDAAPVLFRVLKELRLESFPKPQIKSKLLELESPAALKEVIAEALVVDTKTLRIEFPQENSIVTPDYNGRVFIKYKGGEGQVYLNVGSQQYMQDYFVPAEEGFYKVSLLDEKGRSVSVNFRVVFD